MSYDEQSSRLVIRYAGKDGGEYLEVDPRQGPTLLNRTGLAVAVRPLAAGVAMSCSTWDQLLCETSRFCSFIK